MLRLVNQHFASAFASSLQHLRGTTEAWEIGSRTQDIESSLERFQQKHDHSIRSFYAYVSAPASSDLLKEHGFVGFDESGEQAVQTESIDALNSGGFTAIWQCSESCKERLRPLRTEEPDRHEHVSDDTETWAVDDTALTDDYRQHVANHIDVVCERAFTDFFSSLSERLSRLSDSFVEEKPRFARAQRRIWRARATLLGRFALISGFVVIASVAFAELVPEKYTQLVSMLPDDLWQTVALGAAPSLIVLALV